MSHASLWRVTKTRLLQRSRDWTRLEHRRGFLDASPLTPSLVDHNCSFYHKLTNKHDATSAAPLAFPSSIFQHNTDVPLISFIHGCQLQSIQSPQAKRPPDECWGCSFSVSRRKRWPPTDGLAKRDSWLVGVPCVGWVGFIFPSHRFVK